MDKLKDFIKDTFRGKDPDSDEEHTEDGATVGSEGGNMGGGSVGFSSSVGFSDDPLPSERTERKPRFFDVDDEKSNEGGGKSIFINEYKNLLLWLHANYLIMKVCFKNYDIHYVKITWIWYIILIMNMELNTIGLFCICWISQTGRNRPYYKFIVYNTRVCYYEFSNHGNHIIYVLYLRKWVCLE